MSESIYYDEAEAPKPVRPPMSLTEYADEFITWFERQSGLRPLRGATEWADVSERWRRWSKRDALDEVRNWLTRWIEYRVRIEPDPDTASEVAKFLLSQSKGASLFNVIRAHIKRLQVDEPEDLKYRLWTPSAGLDLDVIARWIKDPDDVWGQRWPFDIDEEFDAAVLSDTTEARMATGTPWDWGERPERWERFVSEICSGDQDMVRYLRALAGYCLTGATSGPGIYFLVGDGENGKSVFVETLFKVLGDYADVTTKEAIMARSGGGPSPDVVKLMGRRLVKLVEWPQDTAMDESKAKGLTGGETITARGLYRDSVSFAAQYKLLIMTNHLPIINGEDHGIWRRLQVIPFKERFRVGDPRRDGELAKNLETEYEGILRWMVAGFIDWWHLGQKLPPCPRVEAALRELQSDSRPWEQFLEEECEFDSLGRIPRMEVLGKFNEFLRRTSRRPTTYATLGQLVGAKAPLLKLTASKGGKFVSGLKWRGEGL